MVEGETWHAVNSPETFSTKIAFIGGLSPNQIRAKKTMRRPHDYQVHLSDSGVSSYRVKILVQYSDSNMNQ